jgi:hypothetical protein
MALTDILKTPRGRPLLARRRPASCQRSGGCSHPRARRTQSIGQTHEERRTVRARATPARLMRGGSPVGFASGRPVEFEIGSGSGSQPPAQSSFPDPQVN